MAPDEIDERSFFPLRIIRQNSTMPLRNNVTRLLDARRVAYELFEFSPERYSAEEVAERLGVPPGLVYKTPVVLRETKGKKPLLVMTPGGRELNLKALAASLGEKKLKMATQREAEDLNRASGRRHLRPDPAQSRL
jgi:Cys-tRNA(Pro)/Cys-tRNA(Cys) deacylase